MEKITASIISLSLSFLAAFVVAINGGGWLIESLVFFVVLFLLGLGFTWLLKPVHQKEVLVQAEQSEEKAPEELSAKDPCWDETCRYSGTLTEDNNLPHGLVIIYSGATIDPVIKSENGITIVEFGNGSYTFDSNTDSSRQETHGPGLSLSSGR